MPRIPLSQDLDGSMGIFFGDMEEAGASDSGYCSLLVPGPGLCVTNLPTALEHMGPRIGIFIPALKQIHAETVKLC